MSRFCIVANGESAKGFKPPPQTKIIAVNGAIDWLDRADYWFTLDPSPENVTRMKNQRKGVKYYYAFNKNLGVKDAIYLERVENPRLNYMGKYIGVSGLQFDANKISTGNSAYGALNLALHLGAKKILFIGLDGTKKRADGTLSGDLSHLKLLFSTALRDLDFLGVKVKNANLSSKVNCLDCCDIESGLEWLK